MIELGDPLGRPRRRRGRRVLVVLTALALAAGAAYLFLPEALPPPPPPAALDDAPPPAPPTDTAGEPLPEIALPPLAESDPVVQDLAIGVSSHPDFARLMPSEGLLQRLVAVVDNVADGVSPRPHLAFLAPEDRFRVIEDGARTVLDPASYARYDLAADLFASLDPAACVRLYRQLEPLVDEAYRKLGYPDGDFDHALARAIAQLLATPVVEGPIELLPLVTTYEFADERLETLTYAQRHFLRMGPRNVGRVQAQLRAIAAVLGIAGGPPPPAGG